MAVVKQVEFRGRRYVVQRVLLADKSGHIWLWNDADESAAHFTAYSLEECYLSIGADAAGAALASVVEPSA